MRLIQTEALHKPRQCVGYHLLRTRPAAVLLGVWQLLQSYKPSVTLKSRLLTEDLAMSGKLWRAVAFDKRMPEWAAFSFGSASKVRGSFSTAGWVLDNTGKFQRRHSLSCSFWLIVTWMCTKERDCEAKKPREPGTAVMDWQPGAGAPFLIPGSISCLLCWHKPPDVMS